MSIRQRADAVAAWNRKSAKIEEARAKRGLDAANAGADIDEISTAMTASSKNCDEDSTDSEDNMIPTPPIKAENDENIPSMPVLTAAADSNDTHREKHFNPLLPFPGMVAKSISIREAQAIPKAKAALDTEWKKLWDMKCWDVDTVCELEEAKNRATKSGETVHFGRVFPIVVEKSSELPPDQRK